MTIDFGKQINLKSLSPQTEFEEKVISFLQEWYNPTPTVKVQTSGSTGVPKLFDIEKSRMKSSAQMTCDFLNLKEGDSALVCLPVEYISGKMMVVRAIERKLKLSVIAPSAQPLNNLNEQIDFCALSPLQVENSLQKLSNIKKIIIGGAQVSEKLQQKLHQTLDKDQQTCVYETYGMSETLSHIALKQIYPQREEYFKTLDKISIDTDNRDCLRIYAPALNPEVLQTNDIVELKGSKSFRFIGRYDNVINSGGLKIHPEELENFLKKNLSNELILFGKKDELLGEKLTLAIEAEKSAKLETELLKLFDALELEFSKNHKPREVIYLKEFPRLPNGKVDRRKIIQLINE